MSKTTASKGKPEPAASSANQPTTGADSAATADSELPPIEHSGQYFRREHLAHQAAIAYYIENQTMEAIHRRLGVSRSTVSRLLAFAREEGIVTINVRPSTSRNSYLARKLKQRFGVNARIVELPEGVAIHRLLEIVGKVAAQLLDEIIIDGDIVGIAWGNTTSEVVQHLRKQNLENTVTVQLNGAASTETSGLAHAGAILQKAALQWSGSMIHFPVPAFFENPDTKEALWQEGSVRRVLEWQARCSIALFGVGALRAEMPSHVYRTGYISRRELAALEKNGVVGDVCTVLLRADGSWRDIALNRRATGPNPEALLQIPRRICVVAGRAKASALAGALNAGLPTDLICDKGVVERALEIMGEK